MSLNARALPTAVILLGSLWLMACAVSAQTSAGVAAKTREPSQPPPPVVTADDPITTQIEIIYRLGLRPGDLLLESVEKFIKDHDIQDGAVLTGIGSLAECTFRFPERAESPPTIKEQAYQGPLEMTGMQGLIADGEPHLHMSVAEHGHERTIGGHLWKGCKVLYLAEITIAKFRGPKMTRKANEHGVKLLEPK